MKKSSRLTRLLALAVPLLALPGLLSAQTLLHRYSFISDASDSVGGANGSLVAPNGGSMATINNGLTLPGGGGGGHSGYVALPSGILTATTNLTIECWMTQNTPETFAELWDFANDGNHTFGLIPYPGNNNNDMEVAFTPHGNEVDLQSSVSFPNNSEQYVAVTFNASTLAGNLYTNAALVATHQFPDATYTPGTIGGAAGTDQNWIGNDTYGDSQFQGTVYELRIWNGVVSQRYLEASELLGPGTVPTNVTPTSISVTANSSVVITGTAQAAVTVQLQQTGTANLAANVDATNWTSSNPNVLAVNSNGVVTGVSIGSGTVSATVGGVTGTSGAITVTGTQALLHRYSFVSDATDSVGGANGTLIAPLTTNGTPASINNGLTLPGGGGGGFSGYLALPSGILTNTSSITVDCWVTQAKANEWAELWDFGNNGNQNFALIPDPGNNGGHMSVAFTPNGGEVDLQSGVTFPTNAEQYVCVTYNNYTLTGKMYTNGALVATQTYPNTTYAPGSIGGAAGTLDNWLGNDVYNDTQFQGTVYEFRIWNGAQSPVYAAVSAAAGPGVIVTNLTPQSINISVTTSMIGSQTQQATVTGNFADASGVTVTDGATNWISSNPSVLTVSSSGLITALNGGTAKVSATVDGVSATSATITVASTAPTITQSPASQTVVLGQTVTFSIQALGGGLSYLWSFAGAPIVGATNATLTLNNVGFTNTGTYTVLVSNSISTASASAVLTVVQQLIEHRYSFISNAVDSIGGANGTNVPPNGGAAATIDNGLFLPGNTHGGYGYSGYVSLPQGLLTNTSSVTVECWVTQNQGNQWAEIWDFGSDNSHTFGLIPDPANNNGNMEVAFTPHGNEVDLQSAVAFPNGSEQYVTVTFNSATLTGDLYTNGVLVASKALPDSTYIPGTFGGAGGTTENMLGNDVFGDDQFDGTIYEFRIWNGVVSPLYLALSAAAGPTVLVTNFTPTSITVSVPDSSLNGEATEQATVVGNFMGVSGVTVTDSATNWVTSNPAVLTVDSNGVVTATGGGSATISATVNGTTGTSGPITVPDVAPIITTQPDASAMVVVGGTFHATVGNIGVGPITYYWYYNNNTTPISGATTDVLTIPNVQMTNAGTYTVVVSNQYGGTTSSSEVLTVIAPTVFEQDLEALHPLALWPLNEASGSVAYDVIGGFNGTYVGDITLGQPGPTNAIYGSNSYSAGFDAATTYVDIPEGPFDITNAVTVMAWVNAQSSTFGDIVGHGDPSYRITVNGTAGQPGGADGSEAPDATDPNSIYDGNWHLVVYTYNGTTNGNNGLLYVDGSLVASQDITAPPAGDDLDLWIGGAPDYGSTYGSTPPPRLFMGNIADAAIFPYALTAAEVKGLYSGQVSLTITLSGKNAVITFPAGTLLQSPTVNGPWTTNTATSPYTVPASNGDEFYEVVQ